MATVDPETLLKDSEKTSLKSGIFLSLVIHLVVIALTSFGLYKAWMKWGIVSEKGFNTPGVIKQLEKDAAKAAEQKAREDKEAAEALAAQKANAKEMSEEDAKAEAKKANATAATEAKESLAKAEAAAKTETGDKTNAPEQTPLDKQVEVPPKDFDLNSIDL